MRDTMGDAGLSCLAAEALLEKQFAEEPLLDRENLAVQAHLAECPECRRVVDWMSALPTQAEAHAERRFHSGLDAAYQTSMKKRAQLQNRDYFKKLAMASAVAAILVVVMFVRPWPFDGARRDAAAVVAVECRPVPPEEMVSGVVITYCDDESPDVFITNDGDVRVGVQGGTVGMLIDPNRPRKRKVSVVTPQGEVRVKGTMFTVKVDKRSSQVEVFRGVVEFVPTATAGETLLVKAGQGADLRRQRVFAISAPRTASIRQVLYTENRQRLSEPASPVGELAESTSGETAIALDESDPAAAARRSPSERPFAPPVSSARPGATPSKRGVPSIDRLIHEAQACLIARDWRCASSRYRGILKHYPKRPESTAALISLARIELRHLGKPREALDHYRTYQKRAPDGPMAEEALFGIATTYRRLGEKALERATLRRFIERFPGSSQIKRAHRRLNQLDR